MTTPAIDVDKTRAELKRLTERCAALEAALRAVNATAIERGDQYGACDEIDNDGEPYQSQWLADLLAARALPQVGTQTITDLAQAAGMTIAMPAEGDAPALWHAVCTPDLERFAALAVARALPQQVEAGSIDSDEFRGRIIACASALMAGTEAEGNAECAELITYIDARKATPASAEGLEAAILAVKCTPPEPGEGEIDDGETYAYQQGHRAALKAAVSAVCALLAQQGGTS